MARSRATSPPPRPAPSPARRRDGLRRDRPVDGDAVAAGAFGFVEPRVGALYQRIGAVALAQLRDAERRGDLPDRLAAGVERQLLAFELAADVLREGLGVGELGLRQDDGEFLAAEPRHGITAL